MWKYNSSEALCQGVSKQYQADLKKVGSEEEITQLTKKRGGPLTLGNFNEKVQQYIRALRKAGTPVNDGLVLAAAEGIVKATDHTLLFENSGHIILSLDWAYSLLRRMGYVKIKATTKVRTALILKKNLCCQETIPLTDQERWWDQTGVNVVPSFQWTQAEKGTTRVEIAGAGDKQQITVTVAGTLRGKLLPFQILYKGKTEQNGILTAG